MRYRKIRQWMIEQNRIETGECLPYKYDWHGKTKRAIKEGTNYSIMIRYRRMWLNTLVDRRSLRRNPRIHIRINSRSNPCLF